MIESLKDNKPVLNKLITAFMLLVSFMIGICLERYFLKEDINISYISQSELMELEKARLTSQDLSSRQLFLGEPDKAIKLIEELQLNRSKGNNIVLISEKAIYGKRVKSISNEIHNEILTQLSKSLN